METMVWMIEKDGRVYSSDNYYVDFTDRRALMFSCICEAENYTRKCSLTGTTIKEHIFDDGKKESTTPIMKFFTYKHLPEKLQAVSELFCKVAENIDEVFPDNEEKAVCLRKLLEAKDAAVRATI